MNQTETNPKEQPESYGAEIRCRNCMAPITSLTQLRPNGRCARCETKNVLTKCPDCGSELHSSSRGDYWICKNHPATFPKSVFDYRPEPEKCPHCSNPVELTDAGRKLCFTCNIYWHLDGTQVGVPVKKPSIISQSEAPQCNCGAPPGYCHSAACALNRKELCELAGKQEVYLSILSSAAKLIEGDRREAYGPVEESFEKIAQTFTIALSKKLKEPVDAADVALCMVGLKFCREAHKSKRDNRIDGAAYWALRDKVLKEDSK